MRCGGLHEVANTAYLKGFFFYDLHRVARYCVRGGVKVVSIGVRLSTFALSFSVHL